MALSGIGSLLGSQESTEIERLRRERESKSALGQMGGNGDTVNISDEGKRLAAEMRARQARDQENQEAGERADGRDRFASAAVGVSPDEEDEAADGTGAAEGAGGQGGASGSSDASEVARIEKQIEQLESKLQAVAASNMPETVKQSAINSYQAQIAELQARLQEAQKG